MRMFIEAMLVVVIFCTLAQAGEHVAGITGMGIKLGLGSGGMNTSIENFKDIGAYFGGTIGCFVTYSIAPNVSLQPELLFVSKGAGDVIFNPLLMAYGQELRFDYLELPVLLKYSPSCKGKLMPSIYLGPVVGYLISAKFKTNTFADELDIKDAMKSIDLGFAVGGAVDFHHFIGDIRYTHGMVNSFNQAKMNQLLNDWDPVHRYNITEDDHAKNWFLAFTLGYRF